ncbi:MAG: hypothetical protein Aurels2KO_02320 [Aureliella sp.]
MSRITKIWKRHLRPKLLAAVKSNVVAAPTRAVTAERIAERNKAEYLVAPIESSCTLPSRPIIDPDGHLARFLSSHPAPQASSPASGLREVCKFKHRDFAIAFPGRIAGNDGAVISDADELVTDVSGVHFRSDDILDPLSTGKLARPTQLEHPVALVSCWRSDNYYHWLIDGLARLRHMESSLTPETRIYAPARKHFQRQSIAMLGFLPEQIVAAKYGTHVASPRVMAASARTQSCSRGDCDYLHERFTQGLSSQPHQRVFLSRRRRGIRSLVNEREIYSALKPLGFRRVLLEDLAFEQQVKLFHSAEAIVAPHGAGLANLVFAQSGTKVLEITTPYRLYGYHCFYEIAHHREQDYRALVAKPVNSRDVDLNAEPGDSDIYAPAEHVLEQVRDMLVPSPLKRSA